MRNNCIKIRGAINNRKLLNVQYVLQMVAIRKCTTERTWRPLGRGRENKMIRILLWECFFAFALNYWTHPTWGTNTALTKFQFMKFFIVRELSVGNNYQQIKLSRTRQQGTKWFKHAACCYSGFAVLYVC